MAAESCCRAIFEFRWMQGPCARVRYQLVRSWNMSRFLQVLGGGVLGSTPLEPASIPLRLLWVPAWLLFCVPAAPGQLLESLGDWTLTPEQEINEQNGAARRQRFPLRRADELQAYLFPGAQVRSVGVNPAWTVTSNRRYSVTFSAKEDCVLNVFAYLRGRLERDNAGQANISAQFTATDITNGGPPVLQINNASDAGRWQYARAVNGTQDFDDTRFARVNISTGRDYGLNMQLQYRAGELPANTAGLNLVNLLNQPDEDTYCNIVFALTPRAGLENWRGRRGIDCIGARAKDEFRSGGNRLTGSGVNIGMIELGAPIRNHADMPAARLEVIVDATRFPNATNAPFRDEHPTAVAGVMVANPADENLKGVAPRAKVFSIATTASPKRSDDPDENARLIVDVFKDALDLLVARPVQVINVSAKYPPTLKTIGEINGMVNRRIFNDKLMLVASGGNDGRGSNTSTCPAAATNAVCVGALDWRYSQVAEFSNSLTLAGEPPHLIAPGEFIEAPIVVPLNAGRDRKDANPPNDYDRVFYGFFRHDRGLLTSGHITGTSFSSPMVAGTVALIREMVRDARFNAIRAMAEDPRVIRAALMSSAYKFRADRGPLRLKNGTEYRPADVANRIQNINVYAEMGAGTLFVERSLRLMNDREQIRRFGGRPGPDQMPSDPPGEDPLARMVLTGPVFYDLFKIEPGQQQEYSRSTEMMLGDEITVSLSWLAQGEQYDESRDLNLAIALYRDTDLSDGVGSDLLIEDYEILPDGVRFPEKLGNDPLIMTADAGWATAEHLYFQVFSGSDEGFYYFRVVNLSGNKDDFALAGTMPGGRVGACCLEDGSCIVTTESECSGGGEYQGDDTSCDPNNCPQPTRGACCYSDGSCLLTTPDGCNGDYLGDDTDCDPDPCPQPATGACCLPDGSCLIATEVVCVTILGGAYRGNETGCDPNDCPQPVYGACCYFDGSCEVLTFEDCEFFGGDYQGGDTDCDSNLCPQTPLGGCCYADGTCAIATELSCFADGGEYQGDNTGCDPNPCPPPVGGCCLAEDTCVTLTRIECEGEGGAYRGDGDTCSTAALRVLVVTNLQEDGTVVKLNAADGSFVCILADLAHSGVKRPNGVLVGPDGNIYVASVRTHSVVKVSVLTGSRLRTFSGGLNAPVGLALRGSALLVGSQLTHSVVAFDADSGELLGTLVESGAGGLNLPGTLLITPAGNLLVCSEGTDQVLEFDGETGEFIKVAAEGSGLDAPGALLYDSAGYLLVANSEGDSVLKFWPEDGTFIETFVAPGAGGLDKAVGMLWNDRGNLLVCSRNTGQILEFDGATGEFVAVLSDDASLTNPQYMVLAELEGDANGNGVPDDCDIHSGGSEDRNQNCVPDEAEENYRRGDPNCDGYVDFNDIDPFVAALIGPVEYYELEPDCNYLNCDINFDGAVDFDDIDAFVACLVNGGCE
jgi:hypothetical protein